MQNKQKKQKVQSSIDSDSGGEDDEEGDEDVDTADGKDGETADGEDGETADGQADGSDEAAELSQDDNDPDYTPPQTQKTRKQKRN